KVTRTIGPRWRAASGAGCAQSDVARPERRSRATACREPGPWRRLMTSAGVVQPAIAVGEDEDPLDVDPRLLDRQPLDERVDLARSRIPPEALDPVRAGVVSGERELDVAVEHSQHLPE